MSANLIGIARSWIERQIAIHVCGNKSFFGTIYGEMANAIPVSDFSFMNVGYAPLDARWGPELDKADELHRLSIQLYAHVIDGIDLTRRDVLEVGSGRGGGCSYLRRYHRPRSVIGLEYAQGAVDRASAAHQLEGLEFRQGDAEAMPFPDASFDVVVNVESSHCYPSMVRRPHGPSRFLTEVARVLRPGGRFVFTDLRMSRREMGFLQQRMLRSGLHIMRSRDITRNVLESRRQASEAPETQPFRELLWRWAEIASRSLSERKHRPPSARGFVDAGLFARIGPSPKALHDILWNGLFLKGTTRYDWFERGLTPYHSWVLAKV